MRVIVPVQLSSGFFWFSLINKIHLVVCFCPSFLYKQVNTRLNIVHVLLCLAMFFKHPFSSNKKAKRQMTELSSVYDNTGNIITRCCCALIEKQTQTFVQKKNRHRNTRPSSYVTRYTLSFVTLLKYSIVIAPQKNVSEHAHQKTKQKYHGNFNLSEVINKTGCRN